MTAADVPGAVRMADAALGFAGWRPTRDDPTRVARARRRHAHLLTTDPGGCWVADHRGEVVGVALALVREGLWGLSLLAVDERLRGRGVGRELLDGALSHGRDATAGLIVSSEDPRAMRRYARAGFDLRPAVAAAGIVRSEGLEPTPGVRPARADAAFVAEVSRRVRGAAHGDDLGLYAEWGLELLAFEDRGFVVHDDGSPRLLAARDDAAAAMLLRAALAAAPPGRTVLVDFITAGNDWAVRTCLDAGLALSADGPVFTRGEIGPLRPYLPSGPFL